jgi:hypothetical protein
MSPQWAISVAVAAMIVLHGALGTHALAAPPEAELPLLSIKLTVDESGIGQFVEHLKKFGDDRAFAIRVTHDHTWRDNKHVVVELWRGDINMSAFNPFDDPRQFSLAVYQTGVVQIPATQIDALIEDLKGLVGKLDGVTIDAIKRR